MKLLSVAFVALLTLMTSACVTVVDEPATAMPTPAPQPTLAVPPQVRENPVNYPPEADGERGTAMVQVMVLASGRTGDSVLVQSAGSEVLDRAAPVALRPGPGYRRPADGHGDGGVRGVATLMRP